MRTIRKGFAVTAVLIAGVFLYPLIAGAAIDLRTVDGRTISRDKPQSEDIVWTLRSSRSTQPVLRIAEGPHKTEPLKPIIGPDYTGYFQLYSTSVETTSGTMEGVGSQFSVTMPLDP